MFVHATEKGGSRILSYHRFQDGAPSRMIVQEVGDVVYESGHESERL